MGEALNGRAKRWTAKDCIKFLDEYEGARQEFVGSGLPYVEFMESRAGTFPTEVLLYMRKKELNIPLPRGELARAFSNGARRLPGVEIVDTNG